MEVGDLVVHKNDVQYAEDHGLPRSELTPVMVFRMRGNWIDVGARHWSPKRCWSVFEPYAPLEPEEE